MVATDTKQLLDKVFVIPGIIQVGESVISWAEVSITKAESNNYIVLLYIVLKKITTTTTSHFGL